MIKVFNATDKNYATHGDLILQPSKAVVHKEDNGEFYLDLETPLNEKEHKNTTPEAGQTAEGTSFSITTDLTKQYQVQTLKGQTSQSSTPTPSSPIPINITTGRQVVSVCGKNLFNKNTITSITNGTISNDVITSNAISSDYGGVSANITNFKLQTTTILPSAYTQVEYIENNIKQYEQYIDTGVIPTTNTKIDLDFMLLESFYSGWNPLFGERGSTSATYFGMFIRNDTLMLSPNYAGFDPGASSNISIEANTRYNLKNDKGQFYINGELKSEISTTNTLTTSNQSMYLFAMNQNGTLRRGLKTRIYHCRFYEGTTLIRDFIPCYRNSDNEIGLYDLVNNVFYTNQGTGTFIKGNNASFSPSPDYPQPINITTGEQDIVVCAKNLCDYSTFVDGYVNNIGGYETVHTKGEMRSQFIKVKPNTQYIFSIIETTDTYQYWFGVGEYTSNNTSSFVRRDTMTTTTQTYITFTTSSTTQYVIVSGRNLENATKVQLEEGNQATTYEEYKSKTYKINLGKNLFNKNEITSITGGTISDDVITSNAISSNYGGVSANISGLTLEAGTYILSMKVQKESGTVANNLNTFLITSTPSITKTLVSNPNLTSDYQTYSVKLVCSGTTQLTNVGVQLKTGNTNAILKIKEIQLEVGSNETDYSAYKTPIYLGKIGTYQDYIFRNTTGNPLYDSTLEEGQWYIHKEIGRVVLNGSESWNANEVSSGGVNYKQYFISFTLGQRGNAYSNYFVANGNNIQVGNYFYINNAGTLMVFVHPSYNGSDITSTVDWKSWLSTHNTEVYYVLNTPTNTLIEDEELINQLNAIELLEGLNNVSVSSANLPAILQLKYNFTTAYSNTIKYIDYLVPNNILVANTPQGDQAFRITNIEKTRRKIKLKANHVFYDTMNYLIADSYVVDKNCNDALDHLNNATSDLSPFTTISNITSINSYRCVRKSLYEAIQVVLERWGGHLVRNDWTLGIYDTIGQDNGVTIRYAKNLKDISATYDWNNVVTKLLPVGKDGLLLNETDPDASIYVESATQYDIPYTKTVSFDQNNIVEDNYKDEDGVLDEEAYKQALVDDLYSKAMEYITNNYLPKVNYKLAANVEKVSDVGDRVEVIDEKLGINLMTNIISFDYDCILERYTQIEFGNFTPTLSNLMTQISVHTEEQINASTQTLQVTLNQELTDATDKIWNALGNSYVIYEGDKILVVDTLPKEEATNVIMINNGGIAFSNSGIDGTFSSAWTIDNVLNMEQINVINLTADLIKGGTLKLGSNLNQNGRLEVFDEANTLIAELNKDGLKMYGADGSYVLMNNQVGFSGYDRNDNKIYWVDKDVFHQKKSEVEEEITLVKKMRIIPITIRDNNNQIVNDGIGFVNVGGGV